MLQPHTNDRIRKAMCYRRKKKGIGRYRELPNDILYKRHGLVCIGIGRIKYCWSLSWRKNTRGKRFAPIGHVPVDVAGDENQDMVELVRHFRRERRANR